MIQATLLPNRRVLRVTGADRAAFLQGLVTNDVTQITCEQAIYAALLSPQGRFQYELFISAVNSDWLIDCDCSAGPERAEALVKKLDLYKLRSQVMIENVSKMWSVMALWNSQAPTMADVSSLRKQFPDFKLIFTDPRLPELGCRLFLPQNQVKKVFGRLKIQRAFSDDYDLHRLMLGIPDGSRDMIIDRGIPLECGLDELNAIDWNKGCYMGQELTARTRYRGLVRKRLIPVTIEGNPPLFQAPVFQDGKEVGEMRTSQRGYGLALLRLESLSLPLPFYTGDTFIKPFVPGWMRLPAVNEGGANA